MGDIGFSLPEIQADFFDREKVLRQMDAQTARAQSKFGAFVRQRAKSSMRTVKGTKISKPGRPPYSHVGLVKRLIFFARDAQNKSVVIGPLLFNNKLGNPGAETLEHGGTVQAVNRNGQTTILHYRARPYMQPAFEKELPKAAELFA